MERITLHTSPLIWRLLIQFQLMALQA